MFNNSLRLTGSMRFNQMYAVPNTYEIIGENAAADVF